MRRLSGQDAGFLALELPIQPMNSMMLARLRSPHAGDATVAPLDMDYLRRHMILRLGELPALRWRIVRVPFGLNHPVFIEDPDFDLDYHLRETTLAAPGGDDQLDRLYAGLAGRRLDRRHPLWQLTLVNGLEGGRQAVVLRFHHCLMDGFATLVTLSRIFSGEDHQVVADAVPWQPEPVPGRGRLVLDALRAQGHTVGRLPALVAQTKRNTAAVKERQAESIAVPRMGVDAPASVLNRALTAERRFARASLPVADLQLVKRAAGVSVNDVALAMVAGALRSYLLTRGALPAKPLLASVPVGTDPPGAPPRTYGNRISFLVTSLATDIADPWERLEAIRTVTAESKRQLAILGPELMGSWLEYIPLAIAERFERRQYRKRLKDPDRVDINVLVSNVRGPAAPYPLGAMVVEDLYITGPPSNAAGVNVTLWDYGDRMLFGILTFADSVDAPGELAAGLVQALAELVDRAKATSGGDADGAARD